jgi:hypothetical protein
MIHLQEETQVEYKENMNMLPTSSNRNNIIKLKIIEEYKQLKRIT